MKIKQFGLYFLLGIIIAIAFKFYDVASMFIPAVASACVLSCLFLPMQRFLTERLHNKSLAALLVILFAFVIVLLPIIILLFALQQQVTLLFQDDAVDIEYIQNSIDRVFQFANTRFNIPVPDDIISSVIPRMLSTVQDVVTTYVPKMIYGITGFLLSAIVTFFLMYYLLTNVKKVTKTFKEYFPLSYKNCDYLLKELGIETRTLIYGQLLIAALQGILGGIGFLIFGVHGAILWGSAMMLLAFIPMVGTGFVWVPASILLIVQGSYVSGIGLFIWGAVIVGLSDNILRPKLTSALGQIHPVTVMLGVIIGLKEWGVIGLIIGPIFISVLITLIRLFREEYLEE
jgi:predicted PurR-regulated permease PerM